MTQPTTTGNGELVPRAKAKKEGEAQLVTLVQRMGPELARALPKHVTADRMARIVITALRTTPKLAETTPASFLSCVLNCAQLGLEPNTPLGHAYLIPRRNNRKNVTECTLILGYPGMLELSYRSGKLNSVDAEAVYEGDDFNYSQGLKPFLRLIPSSDADREDRKVTHAYSIFRLKDGAEPFTVLSRAQIEKRRKRSSASEDGPWSTDYPEMAKKSCIRAGWKYIPKSAEIARAIVLDEAPEKGLSQLAVTDPEIVGLLEAQGVDTSESHDPIPATGEGADD
jgi:recombination protein RecT